MMKALVILLVAALVVLLPCSAKRTTKDWSKMNLDDLEKQWEEGDEEEELKTEGEILREQLERRRKQAEEERLNPSTLQNMDPAGVAAMAAGMKDSAGAAMMFADVNDWAEDRKTAGGAGGEKLSKEKTDEVGGRLKELAKLGGLELGVFPIDPGSVLISTQKGWEGKEILDFLLSRPEVSKVTWNNKEFFPPKDEDEL